MDGRTRETLHGQRSVTSVVTRLLRSLGNLSATPTQLGYAAMHRACKSNVLGPARTRQIAGSRNPLWLTAPSMLPKVTLTYSFSTLA